MKATILPPLNASLYFYLISDIAIAKIANNQIQ